MSNVACKLILLPWASAAISPCGKIMTPLREGTSDLCNMLYILFGARSISSLQAVLVALTHMREIVVVEMLMMLRMFPGVSR